MNPKLIIIDSPDHMKTIENSSGMKKYDKLAQLTWEIKALADIYDLPVVCSYQLNRDALKKLKDGSGKRLGPEDIAGSYQIVTILDGMFVFFKNAADEIKDLRSGEWVKLREGILDGRIIRLTLSKSLRICLYDDIVGAVLNHVSYILNTPGDTETVNVFDRIKLKFSKNNSEDADG